jgi:GNAT superfamily N-acetyltransferase
MNRIDINIRPATVDDAEQMAALFMRCWLISLKDFAPDGFIDQFSHETQKQKYRQRAIDPGWLMYIAEQGGNVLGMITARDNPSEPVIYQKEVRALYVDPDFQRQGIGELLLSKVFSVFKKHSIRNAMLWCIKANHRAGSFYEKHGGKKLEGINPPQEYAAMPHLVYTWEFVS